ncbi:unnamed protein product [Brassica oleracea var. botrytis]
MTSNRGTDIFLAGGSDHGTAVKFKTAESMFPSADQSSKEEQENDRNRSVMVQSTTDLDLRRLFLNATSGSNIFF